MSDFLHSNISFKLLYTFLAAVSVLLLFRQRETCPSIPSWFYNLSEPSRLHMCCPAWTLELTSWCVFYHPRSLRYPDSTSSLPTGSAACLILYTEGVWTPLQISENIMQGCLCFWVLPYCLKIWLRHPLTSDSSLTLSSGLSPTELRTSLPSHAALMAITVLITR